MNIRDEIHGVLLGEYNFDSGSFGVGSAEIKLANLLAERLEKLPVEDFSPRELHASYGIAEEDIQALINELKGTE